jgi:riboflavin kinase / FMN adenylyltransferase
VEIYRDCNNCKVQNSVLTVGMFDGVHLGHHQILQYLTDISQKCDGESTLLTFWPHPRQVLEKDSANLKFITTIDEKIELLKQSGLDNLVIIPFTKEISMLSPKQYVKEILIEKLHINTIIIGHDHRFGYKGAGNYNLLIELGEKYGFDVKMIEAYMIDNITISSTKIRNFIWQGNICSANNFLGYNFFINGIVVEGKKIGRTIGFPTANISINDNHKIIPATGVYIALIEIENLKYEALINIGTNPTVSQSNSLQTIEAYILDFDQTIYGKEIKAEFLEKIRDQKKFSSINDLKNQISYDVEFAKSYFNKMKNQK